MLNKNVPGVMTGGGTDSTSLTTSMSGYTLPTGAFAYTSFSENVMHLNESGTVTVGGVPSGYAWTENGTVSLEISVSGPPPSTTTLGSINTTTTTGNNSGADYSEFGFAGRGPGAASPVAGQVGNSPTASAEHQGTSPGSLDTSKGLLSAVGRADVHAQSFTGPEIQPGVNPSKTGIWLQEGFESGSTPTNWQSHPSGTITDTYTLNEPSTLTATGGQTITEGSSDIVSSGTSGDSLYETGSDTQTDNGTGTLTSTRTSTSGRRATTARPAAAPAPTCAGTPSAAAPRINRLLQQHSPSAAPTRARSPRPRPTRRCSAQQA